MLIDDFAPAGRVELIARYATPIPVLCMQGLLGMDQRYSAGVGQAVPALVGGQSRYPDRAAASLHRLMGQLVEEKAADPGPDLVSWMLHYNPGGRPDDLAGRLYELLLSIAASAVSMVSGRLLLELPDARRVGSPRRNGGAGPFRLIETEGALALLISDTAVERLLDRLPDIQLRLPAEDVDRAPGGLPRELEAAFWPVRMPCLGPEADYRYLPEPSFTVAPPGHHERRRRRG